MQLCCAVTHCCRQGWVLNARSIWSRVCLNGSAGIWRLCHGSWHHRSSTMPRCLFAWRTRRSGHCQGITCRRQPSSSTIGAIRSLERYLRNMKVKVYLLCIYTLQLMHCAISVFCLIIYCESLPLYYTSHQLDNATEACHKGNMIDVLSQRLYCVMRLIYEFP